jgi:hypothetical protein
MPFQLLGGTLVAFWFAQQPAEPARPIAPSAPLAAPAAAAPDNPPATIPEPPAAPPEGPVAPAAGAPRAGLGLMNPAMSVIVDGTFGYYGRHASDFAGAGVPAAGDDPSPSREGFDIQELELAFTSAIDPYLEGAVFLTIPNLAGLEVEEGYLVTTSLPFNLQIKAGTFRSQLGRNNTQHLHLQSFTRRPLFTSLLFGSDGLRGPGAQASVLLPLPWFATLYLESFSLGAPDDVTRVATFGGGARLDPAHLTYTLVLEQFWDATDDASLALGLNVATGRLFDCAALAPCPAGGGHDARTWLSGGDLVYRWKPPNEASTYASLSWTTEVFWRAIADGGPTEGAGYSEAVVQFARRFYAGARFDLLGLPANENVPRRYGTALSLTFAPSEFSRFRLYAQEITGPGISSATVLFVQSELSMGAHGAHPY